MTSISMNNCCNIKYFILVNERFSIQNRILLSNVANKYNNAIFFIVVSKDKLEKFPFGNANQPNKVSIETYYRLFVAELLPLEVHKILYLDGDTIVRHSLAHLWNTSMEGHSVAVVHDCDELTHCDSNRLPYPMERGYFNAGIMLINVDYWREHECSKMFDDFVKRYYDKIIYHDQDILNSCLYDSLIWLPVTYNFIVVVVRIPYVPMTKEYKSEINKYKYDPCIVHFASVDKPWKIDCFNPYCIVWRYYWRKTWWRNKTLINQSNKTLKDKIKNFLYRRGLFIPIRGYENFKLKK